MDRTEESAELEALYTRIMASSAPHEGTRLQIGYAIARHLRLDCPAAKVIVHDASECFNGDPNNEYGERYGYDWEYAQKKSRGI